MLIGCSNNIYDQTIEVTNSVWAETDSIAFDFEIKDTEQLYNLFLGVDHKTSYSYQNVYCEVTTNGPSGLVQKQVCSLELASPKGKWLAEDCNNETCFRNIPFIVRTKFEEAGNYKIVLKQYSRTDKLEGINHLRLQIRPHEAS